MRLRSDIEVGAATHAGRRRTTNEDDYLVHEPVDGDELRRRGRLFVVADGMGGVQGGAEASRTAVRELAAAVLQLATSTTVPDRLRDTPPDGLPVVDDADLDGPGAWLREGYARACRRVYELSCEHAALADMGTTMTTLLLRGGRGWLAHVGDSRCLRLRGGKLEQLSRDHSIRKGENVLTRCVGGGRDHEEVDLEELDVQAGDVYVLATDGLWGVVDDAALQRAVHERPAPEAALELVRLANDAGGPDNITVVVVRVRATSPADAAGEEHRIGADEAGAGVPQARLLRPHVPRPRWPWWVLAVGLALGGLAVARGLWGLTLLPF